MESIPNAVPDKNSDSLSGSKRNLNAQKSAKRPSSRQSTNSQEGRMENSAESADKSGVTKTETQNNDDAEANDSHNVGAKEGNNEGGISPVSGGKPDPSERSSNRDSEGLNTDHKDDMSTNAENNKDTGREEGTVTSEIGELQEEATKWKHWMSGVGQFLQKTNSLVKREFDMLTKAPLKTYSQHMDLLRDVVKTIVMTCQVFETMFAESNKEMKSLRLAVDRMGDFIKKAVTEEDLTVWLDLAPNAEEDQMRMMEERRAADKSRMVKAAELRAEVAKAACSLSEAESCAASANVDLQEAIAEAKRAGEDAALALQAAEEARKAAQEKKKAEEEAKRLAEERAKKKAEEEKKKKEEEERHLVQLASQKGTSVADEKLAYAQKKAREEEERKNPRNWPRFIYSVDSGEYDPGVGCVIRAIGGSVTRDDITVTRIDSLADMAVLEETEELISNVISVTTDKDISNIEAPLSLSIPHCGPRGNPSREALIKTLDQDGKWTEVATKDIMFDDIRELKFVEARVPRLGTFMVVLKPKRDHLMFTKKGGKVTSTTDPRVTLNARPGMFRVNANLTLEVHPVDMALVSDVKARFQSDCSELLSSTPIVRFSIVNRKFSKPIAVTIPLPSSSPRPRQRPSTATTSRDRPEKNDKRPSTAKPTQSPSLAVKAEEENAAEENLCLLTRTTQNDQWTVESGVPLTHMKNKDIVSFNMTMPYARFMVISTKDKIPNLTAEKISSHLEGALRQKTVCLNLRQSTSDPCDVVLVCNLASKSDQLLQKLSEEDYEEGPPPSKPFLVKEGQIMELRFRGNVCCQDSDLKLRFVYNSRLKCRLDFSVEEIDKFAQKSFDCYRGFAQIYRKGTASVNWVPEEEKTHNTHARRQSLWGEKDELLGEMLISLPKPEPEPPKPLNTAPVSLKSEGAIDDDILKRISEDLGDEWKRLAHSLNVKKTRIQAILRQNHSNDTQCSIHDMLLTWAKRLPRSVNKVEILANALMSVGRSDLAEDIRGKDYDIRQQRAQSARDSHLRRVFVKIAQDVQVSRQWKVVAEQMGLTAEEISEIENSTETGPDRCFSALRQWQNKMGNKATKTVLTKHLRLCRFTHTANMIQAVS